MPASLGASAGTGGGVFEKGKEVGLAIVWEGEDLLHCVDLPAKDNLLCAPGGVDFEELLEVDFFLPCNVSLLLGRKSLLMTQNICRGIFLISVGPPCVIPMKSLRYT